MNWLRLFSAIILIGILSGCAANSTKTVGLSTVSIPTVDELLRHDEKTKNKNMVSVTQNVYVSKGDLKINPKETVPEPKKTESIVPVQIQIPTINVDTKVVEVGILENGQMGVPDNFEDVGWFEPGYKPGLNGNSVIAGHEDSYTGPAVFFDLKYLEKGDEIKVTDADGKTLIFKVTELVTYKYDEAPIDTIFGPSDVPRLNLITCAGTYDRKTNNSSHRLVVFSELVTEDGVADKT